MDFFEENLCNDIVFEKGWLAISDLMFESDPQMRRNRFGRREFFPMRDYRFLDPGQIIGIVDMSHEVDVGGHDGNIMLMILTHELTLVLVYGDATTKACAHASFYARLSLNSSKSSRGPDLKS